MLPLALFVLLAAPPVPSTADVTARALAARESVTSFDIAFTADTPVDGGARGPRRTEYHVWQTPDNYRCDQTVTSEPESKADAFDGHRRILCWNCESPGHAVRAYDGPIESEVFRATEADRPRFIGGVDPRYAGYRCAQAETWDNRHSLNKFQLGYDMDPANLVDRTTSAVVYEGEPAYKITSKPRRNEGRHEVWVVPGKGWSVARIEYESVHASGTVARGSAVSELVPVPGGPGWFPRTVTFKVTHDGQPRVGQTCRFTSVRLNQPVDPGVFEVSGFGMKNGRLFTTPTHGNGGAVVDNGRLVEREKSVYKPRTIPVDTPAPEPVAPAAVSDRSRWWYALAAVLFAAVAVVFLRRLLRRGS